MRREPITFFLDRNLGKKAFARALREAGLIVQIHDDHFAVDSPDAEWLRVVGQKRWVVITNDRRMRYRPLEWMTFLNYGIRAFTFTSGSLTARKMVEIFLKARNQIFRLLDEKDKAFIAKMSQSGDVWVWKES